MLLVYQAKLLLFVGTFNLRPNALPQGFIRDLADQIVNCCHPNALMTLKEYLIDYASPDTKRLGDELIGRELDVITNPVVRENCEKYLSRIESGERDFRF